MPDDASAHYVTYIAIEESLTEFHPADQDADCRHPQSMEVHSVGPYVNFKHVYMLEVHVGPTM